MILCTVLSFYTVLYLMGNFYAKEERYAQSEHIESMLSGSENIATAEHLSSNDFSLTHKNGKDESVQHSFVHSLQADKLLRDCIFDREKILILTQTLIWFAHSTYQMSLPPLWHPSIPIAHRRLII